VANHVRRTRLLKQKQQNCSLHAQPKTFGFHVRGHRSAALVCEPLNSHSPNHHEFGSGIAWRLFKIRSPLTHRNSVQMPHQIKMKTPMTMWILSQS
jgi:hypothetical protein